MTVNCYGVSCLGWTLVHPRANFDMLGYVPGFIDNSSDVPLREQIDAEYISGWRKSQGTFKREGVPTVTCLLSRDYGERLLVIARYEHKPTGEILELCESAFCALVQKDGSFEVARLD